MVRTSEALKSRRESRRHALFVSAFLVIACGAKSALTGKARGDDEMGGGTATGARASGGDGGLSATGGDTARGGSGTARGGSGTARGGSGTTSGTNGWQPRGDDSRRGTRLRYEYWLTDDGFTLLNGEITDTERGELCAFARAHDGALRCMPYTTGLPYVSNYFADAGCTVPIADGDSPTAAYAVRRRSFDTPNDCLGSDAIEYFESLGALETLNAFYPNADGACVSTPLDSRFSHVRVGRPVPPDAFVAARDEIVTNPSRLGEVHRLGDDGSFARIGLYDTAELHACSARPTSDGKFRCLPDARYLSQMDFYAEPGCSGPRLGADLGCLEHAAYSVEESYEGCHRPLFLYEVGRQHNLETLFVFDQGACRERQPTGIFSGPFAELGAEVDPARFVEIVQIPAGTRRLRHIYQTDGQGGGVLVSPPRAFDSLLGSTCTFQEDDDGWHRCIPPFAEVVFRDTNCTVPLIRAVVPACPSKPPSGDFAASPESVVARLGEAVYRAGPELEPAPEPTFGEREQGNCRIDRGTGGLTYRYYELGAVVPEGLVKGSKP
jgi:hypothetical protein